MWTFTALSRKARPAHLSTLSRYVKMPTSVRYAFTQTPEDPNPTDAPRKPPRLNAEQYAKNNKLLRKHSNRVLSFCQSTFLSENTNAMKFLDVGCGTGDYTRDYLLPICQPCEGIVAIDWSSDMIEYARSHFGQELIKYELLDIAGNGLADFIRSLGLFHRVYSFHCLQWVKRQDDALKNIARLLTPGGECLLLFPASNQPTAAWQILAGMRRWAKYSEVLLSLVPESQNMADKQDQLEYMSSLLSDAGLSPDILVLPRMETFDVCSEEDLIGLYMGIVPIAAIVSDEEKRQLLEDVITLVRKLHGPETDQSLFRMYIIKATKKLKR